MKHDPSFGRFCASKRKENRQLLIQMADAIGVAPARLSSAELGERNPELDWLPGIRDFLKLNEFETKQLEKIIRNSVIASNQSDKREAFASAAFKLDAAKGQEFLK